MAGVEGLVLSANEQQSLEILRQVEEGKISRRLACQLLEVNPRTLCRYLKKYRERGLMALRHGNCGRKPANAHPYDVKAAIHRLMEEVLFDFNLAHARDLINERFNIAVPRETFRRWCHEINAVKLKRKTRRAPKRRRERHSQLGLMLQFDGSPHRWFGLDKNCLIAGIDDATGRILGASFALSENIVDCMAVLREIVERHGVFRVLYVDRAGLYGGMKRRGFSQIARALTELGCKVIYAQSPEGKGRIERLFKTMQDRLVPELRLNKIESMETANGYLKRIYVEDHNRRFAVQPSDPTPGFLPLDPKINLDEVFCVKERRAVARDHTISFGGKPWRVVPQNGLSLAGRRIEVWERGDRLAGSYAGQPVVLEKIEKVRHDKVAG